MSIWGRFTLFVFVVHVASRLCSAQQRAWPREIVPVFDQDVNRKGGWTKVKKKKEKEKPVAGDKKVRMVLPQDCGTHWADPQGLH